MIALLDLLAEFQLMRLRARLESHFLIVGFTRVHTFVTWDSHELTHNLTGSHAQTFVLDWKRHTHKGHTTRQQTATGHTQQDINGTIITCVHTCHLWDSHVFTLFVCGMQRIHKHKKVGCTLTESLPTWPWNTGTQNNCRVRCTASHSVLHRKHAASQRCPRHRAPGIPGWRTRTRTSQTGC